MKTSKTVSHYHFGHIRLLVQTVNMVISLSLCLSVCLSVCLSMHLPPFQHLFFPLSSPRRIPFVCRLSITAAHLSPCGSFPMTAIQHNALLGQTRSADAWWSAPLGNLAATWTNWFSDRLKKIKQAIKTSRKVLNGPYVHNKLSYVFFASSSTSPSILFTLTGHRPR